MTTPAQTAKDQALAALRSGDVPGAAAAAERAVALDASYAEGWAALGTVAMVSGDAATAERHLAHALALKPIMAEVHLNHAVALTALGRLTDALDALEQAVIADPAVPAGGALSRLMPALQQHYDSAPSGESGALLARALTWAGKPAEAEAVLRACCAAAPEDGDLLDLLGAVLIAQGKHAEAEAAAAKASLLKPDDPAPLVNVAGMRLSRGDKAGAEEQARLATRRFPDNCRAWTLLSDIIRSDDDRGWEALSAAARCPDATGATLSRTRHAATRRLDWDSVDALAEPLNRMLDDDPVQPGRLLVQTFPPERIRANAEKYCAVEFPRRRPIHAPAEAKGGGKLRVGYVSPDFGPHPVGTTILDLFKHHDRERFEIHAYAIGPERTGKERQAIEAAVDSFNVLPDGNDFTAARRIRDDGIDILIDLAGHTQHARLEILAFRPAPLQMHYLGYPSTTGAPFIDYLVGDPWTVPPEHEVHFSEAIIRLPHTYLVNTRRPAHEPGWDRARFGFGPDQVILCSFNHAYKITRQLFECWATILRAVPEAVLWLRADHPAAIANLRAHAVAQGIAAERLVFAPRVAFGVHLARYQVAELMLDTVPYNGHTTTADALWMGCPTLTAPSDTFASRVCAGLLAAAGTPETIARDLDDYAAKAIALARDASARADLRRRLDGVRDGVLFDNANFARLFEAGLLAAWDRATAGLPPATIDIAPRS